MPDANGNALEIGCEVTVASRPWHGSHLPEYRGAVVALQVDAKGPIVVIREKRSRRDRLARPAYTVVTRGLVPEAD